MSHLAKHDGFNGFRPPVEWQFLVNKVYAAERNADNSPKFDALVQACLVTGRGDWCIINIHNYARWNGGIVGQEGPEITILRVCRGSLRRIFWGRRVMMGLMNEPNQVENWLSMVSLGVLIDWFADSLCFDDLVHIDLWRILYILLLPLSER